MADQRDTTPVAIGFDLGGTKLSVCTINAAGHILDSQLHPSPAFDPEGTVEQIAHLTKELGDGLPVGVGLAGISDHDGNFIHGPNFYAEPWPFREKLAARCTGPLVVGNEGRFALWAEHKIGAAKGHDNVVMFLLGTGVGGGLILGGQLFGGANGFAGELGHMILSTSGPACRSPMPGSVECHCSGRAIEAAARRRLRAGEESVLVDNEELTGLKVADAAKAGDDVAIETLRQVGHDLGVAVASMVNAVDPSIVVVGGGVMDGAATWLIPAADAVLHQRVLGAPHRTPPRIVRPQFGNDAGMIGAALYAHERHTNNTSPAPQPAQGASHE